MKFLRCLGATVAFWLCLFFGPAILVLVENIAHLLSFGEWGENRGLFELIIYKAFQFLAQPIACWIAYEAMKKICTETMKTCVVVNCIVAAIFCGIFAFSSLLAANISNVFTMVITAVVAIVLAVNHSKK